MSDSDQSEQRSAVSVQVENDNEGQLTVAGRDVVVHNVTHVNVPFPQTLAGRAILSAGLLILIVVISFAFGLPQKLGLIKPFPPAREGEILVIVTDFTGQQAGEISTRIYASLSERVAQSDLPDVRIERLEGTAPRSAREAQAIGQEYRAIIVIWGIADQYAFEPHYEVSAVEGITYTASDLGVMTPELPTFTASVATETPEEYQYLMLFSLGQMLYFSRDYKQAADLFDQAAAIDLGSRGPELGVTALHMYRVVSLFLAGDDEAALQAWLEAVLASRDLAAVALEFDVPLDLEQSNQQLAQQIEAAPTDADLYLQRAANYYVLGEYEAQIADADRAIELDPSSSRAYQMRGIAVEALDGPAAAMDDLTLALEADPDNASALHSRGFALALIGDFDAALLDLNQAVALKPEVFWVYVTRGFVYDFQGNTSAATADYRAFLGGWPNNPFTASFELRIAQLEAEH